MLIGATMQYKDTTKQLTYDELLQTLKTQLHDSNVNKYYYCKCKEHNATLTYEQYVDSELNDKLYALSQGYVISYLNATYAPVFDDALEKEYSNG